MDGENPRYLTEQLITYIGNKRALLGFIGKGLDRARARLGKEKISTFDVFSGSGIVSRFLKGYSSLLVANDLERYAEIINRCYLANREEIDERALREAHAEIVARLEGFPLERGIFAELYAPENDEAIKGGERVFYTRRNAEYLDTARRAIAGIPQALQPFLLAPLISEASIHANTSGVFKGFHKDPETGIGKFGGGGADALKRIKGNIALPFPVFSNFSAETRVLAGDANDVCETAPEVDLAYLDPPYNQHPYGSNYFMLNLLADYAQPRRISSVSGIPEGWNHSRYNVRKEAEAAFAKLAEGIRAKFLMVSFNSEGFILPERMREILGRIGKTEILETSYACFRGSRNIAGRELRVKEYLYLVERR